MSETDAPEVKRTAGRPLGSKNKRRDAADSPVVKRWEASKEGEAPEFAYQYMRAHEKSDLNEVRDRMRPRVLKFVDQQGNVVEEKRIAGWTVCTRDDDSPEFEKYRDDVGEPVDTLDRDGPHLKMKLPIEDWKLLQRHQEQNASLYEQRLLKGRTETFDIDGNKRPFADGQDPATKVTEKPFQFGRV